MLSSDIVIFAVWIQEHLDLLLTGLREQIHSPHTKEPITKAVGKQAFSFLNLESVSTLVGIF